ncbi:MAG: hypothetical protein NVSMB47_10450 [Polyangiales bacterium]
MRVPRLATALAILGISSALGGCYGATIEPGHRGLLFDPKSAGLKHDILAPGYYSLDSCFLRTVCQRIDDFDISYSTKKEEIQTTSLEGLVMQLKVAVIYRPIISEIYELDTEIGPNYYDEVVGPEFRSAARGVFARHGYAELQKNNSQIEDEIEDALRKRTKGKHVEVASVTMEAIEYAPEIAAAIQGKLVGEQEAAKQKMQLENEAAKRKLEIESTAEQARMKSDAILLQKEQEKKVAEQQAQIDKLKAETDAVVGITNAKAQAEEEKYLAKAEEAKKKAEASGITPLVVQMHAYDALAALGGSGTSIMIGDWSHVPNFLFPGAMFPGMGAMPKAASATGKGKVVPTGGAAPNGATSGVVNASVEK